jgi:hypothetical protein
MAAGPLAGHDNADFDDPPDADAEASECDSWMSETGFWLDAADEMGEAESSDTGNESGGDDSILVNEAIGQPPLPPPSVSPDPLGSLGDAIPDIPIPAIFQHRQGGQRGERFETFEVPGFGELRFNQAQRTIIAVCSCAQHAPDCRKSRTVVESLLGARMGQGRPVGLLVAWLMDGPDHQDKASHNHRSVQSLTHDQRIAARSHFTQLPLSHQLLSYERHQRPNEDDEPVDIP